MWIPHDRTKLGFLDPRVNKPVYPSLHFFLDPRGAYAEMAGYRFLLMSYHAQCYLVEHLDTARKLLGAHCLPRDVNGEWDTDRSIIPMFGPGHVDKALEAPPLILYARLRCKEEASSDEEEASSDEEDEEEGAAVGEEATGNEDGGEDMEDA